MRIAHDALSSLAEAIFAAAGCGACEAGRVSRRLVEANLVGHDSHGVIRIPSYIQWLADGKVIANQNLEVLTSSESMAVLDGRFGLGQSIGEQAIELGIAKARQHGVAVLALRNSGHLGRIGDWAEMAAAEGMISLHFVNSSGAGMLVAPYGGIDRRLSANPLAVGVPVQGGAPLVLDMSACTVAEGKVRVALNRGELVADGCLIDADGKPTNDPRRFYATPPGAILPIAGHKGYGLSVMIEMLAGALTGSSCTNPDKASRLVNGMLSILIDRTFFGESEEFYPEVRRFIDFVKSSRTVSADSEILMPGELEERTRKQRLESGLELDPVTWGQIRQTCRSLGIEHPAIDLSPAGDGMSDGGHHGDGIVIPGYRNDTSSGGLQ